MAHREVRQKSVYIVSTGLPGKYRPLIVRGRPIHEQTPKSAFGEKRKAEETALDLWVDGSVYPVDPSTGKPPSFRTLKGLLEFVGDGEMGLLGYCKNLAKQSQLTVEDFFHLGRDIVALKSKVTELESRLNIKQDFFEEMLHLQEEMLQSQEEELQSQALALINESAEKESLQEHVQDMESELGNVKSQLSVFYNNLR